MSLSDRIADAERRAAELHAKNKAFAAAADAENANFIESSVRSDALELHGIRDLLVPFLRRTVEVNVKEPNRSTPLLLAAVQRESFTVVESSGIRRHIPYSAVIAIVETGDTLFIEIVRQTFVRGAIAFGLSVPI